MKKLLLLATIFVGLGANAQQGGQGGRGMGSRMNMDSLYKVWDVNADQQAKLKVAQDDQRAAMTKLREDQDMSREDRMEKMKVINEDFKKKRDKILTKDQAKKWDDYTEAMRANRGPRNN